MSQDLRALLNPERKDLPKDLVTYNPETDGGFADFGLDYYLPRAFTATVTREDLPCDVEIRAVLEHGRYMTEYVKASRRKGQSVTLEKLRDIPVASLVAEAALTLLYRFQEPMPPFTRYVSSGVSEIAKDMAEGVEQKGTLEHVAVMYRVAHACGAPPTHVVAEALAISRATAGRWIAAAREEGFLGPAIERRPGEQKKTRRKRAR